MFKRSRTYCRVPEEMVTDRSQNYRILRSIVNMCGSDCEIENQSHVAHDLDPDIE